MLFSVITARGGSRRMPGKNSKSLFGVSLLERSVRIAKAADIFDRIIVSTDDEKLVDIARAAGAEVPFVRPSELAQDDSSSLEVLYHLLVYLKLNVKHLSICLMQPTSPLLRPEQLHQAYQKFVFGGFTSLSSMTRVFQHPEWLFKKPEDDGRIVPADLKQFNSGKTAEYLIENGAFYFVNADWVLSRRSLYNFENHGFYLMPFADSIDIDTEEDWRLAEAVLRSR